MHTGAEIEALLGEAAQRMRQVSKAAKDQAARDTGEPADVPQPPLGDVTQATGPTGKPPGQNVP